jgi:hypothetical protein
MKADYIIKKWRADQELPVIIGDKPELLHEFTQVGLSFTVYLNEGESYEQMVIIDLHMLKAIREIMGKIWAIKFVRGQSITRDEPRGCSLLTAKQFVELICPDDAYIRIDNERIERIRMYSEFKLKQPDPRD